MTAPLSTHEDRVAPDSATRLARYAVSVVFFLTGAGTANWVVRIPAVQHALGLSDGRLGVALLGLSAGAIVAMAAAGRLVGRYGSRPITWVGVVSFAIALALPPLATNLLLLTIALFTLGMANGLLDVAMNAQAAAVQRRYDGPIMTRIHALYSFGGLAGAASGGWIASLGIGAAPHMGVVGLAILVGASAVALRLLPASADAAVDRPTSLRPVRALRALGLVAFCVLFGEGAMANWSTVYLSDVGRAGPGVAALGFASFSVMMTVGRGAGDALTRWLGPVRLVRFGGTLATLGMALALSFTQPLAMVVGFGAVGAGLSSVFPTVLAASARIPGVVPGAAIAAVSICGYAAMLAGPPLIGAFAGLFTLRVGLAVVAVSSAAVVVLARTVRPASTPPLPRRLGPSPADGAQRGHEPLAHGRLLSALPDRR